MWPPPRVSGLCTVGDLDLGGLGLHPEVQCPLCFCDLVLTWMFGRVIYSAVSSKCRHLVTAAHMHFIILPLTFKPLTYFELMFICGIR